MVTTEQQRQIEALKASARTLRRIAADVADWQDADAINAEADRIADVIFSIELEAQGSGTEDHPALDRAA